MKYYFWIILVCCSFGYYSAHSQKTINDPNVEPRQTGSFNSVVVSSAIDLYLTQSKETAVAVSASEAKYVPNITTEVRNNTLYIGYKGSGNWGPKYMKAYVSAPAIYKIQASGACNVKTEGAISGSDLEIGISGSSDFKGTVKVTNLKLNASGSSDFVVDGSAENLRVDVSGSSDVKAFELAADYCDITASGASDVSITVNKELKAKASGASDIYYKGNGVIKEISSSGASDIKKRN